MSLDLHPVSTFQTKVQSPAAWFPSNVYHAYDIKITALQLETAARRFFLPCARPRSFEGTLVAREKRREKSWEVFTIAYFRLQFLTAVILALLCEILFSSVTEQQYHRGWPKVDNYALGLTFWGLPVESADTSRFACILLWYRHACISMVDNIFCIKPRCAWIVVLEA